MEQVAQYRMMVIRAHRLQFAFLGLPLAGV
jgi:hypothetical protein